MSFSRVTRADRKHLPEILASETVGGFIMAGAAGIAVLWANLSPSTYTGLMSYYVGPLSVAHWASDGLLTIFFFIAGMELKRELVEGSLSNPRSALVPIVAAVTGMLTPALIYVVVNLVGHGDVRGWAIPMATDIAFALAVLAIVGSRLPRSLRAFLLTLAIADDLGAIIVIAAFFSHGLNLVWLLAAAACTLVWWMLQRRHVRGWYLYLPLFVLTWWCTLQSGLHATIAGVVLGLLVWTSLDDDDDTLDRWQHHIHPWSAGLAVPLFALASAGVAVTPETMRALVTNPVPLGILLGLVVGKLVGVFAGAYLTSRTLSQGLSGSLRWREVLGASQLAGIGFTVSLLISELSFPDDHLLAQEAKTAVLTASLISAVVGGTALRRRNTKRRRAADRAGITVSVGEAG